MTSASRAAARRATNYRPSEIESIIAPPKHLTGADVKDVSLYRLPQVLARLGISRSTWYDGIGRGRFPAGYAISPRLRVWRSDEIDAVVASLLN